MHSYTKTSSISLPYQYCMTHILHNVHHSNIPNYSFILSCLGPNRFKICYLILYVIYNIYKIPINNYVIVSLEVGLKKAPDLVRLNVLLYLLHSFEYIRRRKKSPQYSCAIPLSETYRIISDSLIQCYLCHSSDK
jgi:hypothetical protein